MRQGDLARLRDGAAARKTDRRDRVVRTAEGAGRYEGVVRIHQAEDGMDLRDLQRFVGGHLRQDRGQALGQHAFPGARRSDHQDIVPACGGDLQRALGVFLAHDLLEVRDLAAEVGALPPGLGHDGRTAAQMGDELGHAVDRDHGQTLGQGGLLGVLNGNVEGPDPRPDRSDRHRQNAGDGSELPLQAELAQEGAVVVREGDLLLRGQNAEQNGQVVERAGLFRVGGGKVHGDAAGRELEAGGLDRCANALARLLDRGVGQAHDLEVRQAVGDKALHGNRIALDAVDAHGFEMANQAASLPFTYIVAQSAKNSKSGFRRKRAACTSGEMLHIMLCKQFA